MDLLPTSGGRPRPVHTNGPRPLSASSSLRMGYLTLALSASVPVFLAAAATDDGSAKAITGPLPPIPEYTATTPAITFWRFRTPSDYSATYVSVPTRLPANALLSLACQNNPRAGIMKEKRHPSETWVQEQRGEAAAAFEGPHAGPRKFA